MPAHEQSVGATNEWYTPRYVFDAMGVRFDLDVAHPGLDVVDWVPTSRVISADSLDHDWSGFVWMNPPFGRRMGLVPWLEKFFAHGDGVALVPNRTTPWWDAFAPRADLTLQVSEKIKFYRPDGTRGEQPGTGTTLFAAGPRGVRALHNAAAAGLGTLWLNVKAAA
jgi:hypothetical protein